MLAEKCGGSALKAYTPVSELLLFGKGREPLGQAPASRYVFAFGKAGIPCIRNLDSCEG